MTTATKIQETRTEEESRIAALLKTESEGRDGDDVALAVTDLYLNGRVNGDRPLNGNGYTHESYSQFLKQMIVGSREATERAGTKRVAPVTACRTIKPYLTILIRDLPSEIRDELYAEFRNN